MVVGFNVGKNFRCIAVDYSDLLYRNRKTSWYNAEGGEDVWADLML